MRSHPLLEGFCAACKPADRRPPWQWCEEHVHVDETSPLPGRWRSDASPWVRPVMEDFSNNAVRDIAVQCAAQSALNFPLFAGGQFFGALTFNTVREERAWSKDLVNTGIMTFIVNQQGRVYQRDLGPKTAKTAAAHVRKTPIIAEDDHDVWSLARRCRGTGGLRGHSHCRKGSQQTGEDQVFLACNLDLHFVF